MFKLTEIAFASAVPWPTPIFLQNDCHPCGEMSTALGNFVHARFELFLA